MIVSATGCGHLFPLETFAGLRSGEYEVDVSVAVSMTEMLDGKRLYFCLRCRRILPRSAYTQAYDYYQGCEDGLSLTLFFFSNSTSVQRGVQHHCFQVPEAGIWDGNIAEITKTRFDQTPLASSFPQGPIVQSIE